MTTYTVWVGGGEINAYYLTYEQATELANEYIRAGYNDVVIEEIDNA